MASISPWEILRGKHKQVTQVRSQETLLQGGFLTVDQNR